MMLLVESGTSAKIKNQCVYAELVALVWRDMLVHEANCAPQPQLNFEEEVRSTCDNGCHGHIMSRCLGKGGGG
jgi:hypothetical protein